LGDRIRAFFSKRANPALLELEKFASEHHGVEGYIEPRTTTNPTTLLLVDRDGEHLRAPVREPAEAAAFCNRLGIPVYDAAVIGYPDRMRRRRRNDEQLDAEIADLERRLAEGEADAED
jgi:hypothetical protein